MIPRTTVMLALLGHLCLPSQADMVTSINDELLAAIRSTSASPPRASRGMAMVHTAVFDAVNGITTQYQHYHVAPAAPSGAHAEIAAAAAAHQVLTALYPSQSAVFQANFNARLAGASGSPQSLADGESWGRLVGNAILALRANDNSNDIGIYDTPPGPGVWEPTPPGFAPALLPHWGMVTPFALPSGSAVRPAGPPPLNSAEYAAQYNEVLTLGSVTNVNPTYDEIAYFWADGPGTETPPGHWNSIAKEVLPATHSLVENARVFAALNVALADAGIASWDAKYEFDYWRPVTAIRAGDTDGNPATLGDPSWTPRIITPPFPEYVSGHSTFSGAGAAVLSNLLGSNVAFTSTSDGLPGVTRSFNNFAEAAAEAGMSRIYGGIHFQQGNVDGLAMGNQIGQYVVGNFFAPIPEPRTALFIMLLGFALILRRRAK